MRIAHNRFIASCAAALHGDMMVKRAAKSTTHKSATKGRHKKQYRVTAQAKAERIPGRTHSRAGAQTERFTRKEVKVVKGVLVGKNPASRRALAEFQSPTRRIKGKEFDAEPRRRAPTRRTRHDEQQRMTDDYIAKAELRALRQYTRPRNFRSSTAVHRRRRNTRQ